MNINVASDIPRPWLDSYPENVMRDLPESYPQTLDIILRNAGSTYPERPCVEALGKVLSFRETLDAAERVAAWLQAQGLQKGDRVAVMCPNLLACPVSVFGVLLAGFTVVNVNPLYTARELKHQITDSGAKVLLVLENFAHIVEAAGAQAMGLEKVVIIAPGDLMGLKGHIVNFVSRKVKKAAPPHGLKGTIRFTEVVGYTGPYERPEVEPDDIAFLQYTGGTTGVSKGATLLHRNVAANVAQCDANMGPFLRGLDTDHVMVLALPIYHIFGLTCTFVFMNMGAKLLLIPNPRDIDGFVKTLSKAPVTMFSGVNTLYNALANHKDIGKVDFSKVVFSVAGGMAAQAEVARKWKALSGTPIIEGYGLSETSPVATMNPLSLPEFSGNIGYPLQQTDVIILDDDGNMVAPGETGELAVRGPQVMAGYWNRPEETAKCMSDDGFFKTGDVALMLEDGAFKIVDRKKDMILVSGFNVFPNEVEEIIVQHPAVLEVAVVGTPSEKAGEEVTAYVVLNEGQTLERDELRAFCKDHLTAYKVPSILHLRDELPKTNVGKILRRELRDEAVKSVS
ncbi:MAG: AMP-binding protein [Pseudomonadota bacterium]